MKVLQKKVKTKLYSLRVNEDDMKRIDYLRSKNINLPKMLREYIKEIYDNMMLDEPDNIYSID